MLWWNSWNFSYLFLVAAKRLYKRVCPSVGPSPLFFLVDFWALLPLPNRRDLCRVVYPALLKMQIGILSKKLKTNKKPKQNKQKQKNKNKAGYTTRHKSRRLGRGSNAKKQRERKRFDRISANFDDLAKTWQTDRPTDRQTDTASYRVARARLKKGRGSKMPKKQKWDRWTDRQIEWLVHA